MTERHNALVTGGTGGLGTAICQSLAGIGYRVIANHHPDFERAARQWQQRQQSLGLDFALSPADVSDHGACARMAESLIADLGGDFCVNGGLHMQ